MPISMEKVQSTAPGLIDLYKAAKVSLDKRGLSGESAAVYLVLDRSGSMRRFYKDGTVQHLAEQALALSAHLDDDGVVPVVFFDKGAYPPVEVGLDRYQGRINEEHERLGHMGTTNYAAAMQAVIDHYQAAAPAAPAFVLFQTDGSPNSRTAAEKVLCDASTLPIFWQFIGFGDDEFKFLRKLDDLPVPRKRAIDNAAFFPAGPDPRAIADNDLYRSLMDEFPDWLNAARAAGILT
ncbi:VWA domain-containing protein [Actinomadura rubrisoli]|uniref:VWA domain-containing protein n=1 Tax=Actinomadura rubrisoli TaxID=2530368 RepID=A0A4R5BS10_9ACTN|nr:VWA domain-containing protein [Actinomadura rubrisoli]TDD86814.1 VWA domain-containing protein [Actinomadura rubrisoli]